MRSVSPILSNLMSPSRCLITASILSADLGHLQDEIDTLAGAADAIQVDVMDGHFVPNLSFGAPVVGCLKTPLPLDIHLMVSNPRARVPEFQKIGANIITFHVETVDTPQAQQALIDDIRRSGARCGVALKPGTPVSAVTHLLPHIDLVLVMSVEPGFAGQAFLESALDKIRAIRKAAPDLMIQVDGGITPETAKLCREAGANNLVAATAIFGKKDRKKAIEALRGK